jgi:hypothetical protein
MQLIIIIYELLLYLNIDLNKFYFFAQILINFLIEKNF